MRLFGSKGQPVRADQMVPYIDREEDMSQPTTDTEGDVYAPANEPAPDLTATDPRLVAVDEAYDNLRATPREACEHCRGTGYVMTKNDLLRESLGLIGDGGDEIVREFYARLFDLAPALADLFPADLLGADALHGQRDRLLQALVALGTTYDPDRPDQMAILDRHLESFGRAHASFDRGNGIAQGATLDEYQAVKVVLFGVLHDAAGDAWRGEYDDVWSEAYDYAAGAMLFHGMRSGLSFPRTVRR